MKKFIIISLVGFLFIFGPNLVVQSNDTIENNSSDTYEKLTSNPYVTIMKPFPQGLYLMDRLIGWFPVCTIFGKITIELDAGCYDCELNGVAIIIDGEVVKTFTEPPYEWLWERTNGDSIFHFFEAKAYSGNGEASQIFPLLKFF